jgi:hypothetical protein
MVRPVVQPGTSVRSRILLSSVGHYYITNEPLDAFFHSSFLLNKSLGTSKFGPGKLSSSLPAFQSPREDHCLVWLAFLLSFDRVLVYLEVSLFWAGAHDRWRRIWEEQLDASPTDGHTVVLCFFCAGMQVQAFFVSNITYCPLRPYSEP